LKTEQLAGSGAKKMTKRSRRKRKLSQLFLNKHRISNERLIKRIFEVVIMKKVAEVVKT